MSPSFSAHHARPLARAPRPGRPAAAQAMTHPPTPLTPSFASPPARPGSRPDPPRARPRRRSPRTGRARRTPAPDARRPGRPAASRPERLDHRDLSVHHRTEHYDRRRRGPRTAAPPDPASATPWPLPAGSTQVLVAHHPSGDHRVRAGRGPGLAPSGSVRPAPAARPAAPGASPPAVGIVGQTRRRLGARQQGLARAWSPTRRSPRSRATSTAAVAAATADAHAGRAAQDQPGVRHDLRSP